MPESLVLLKHLSKYFTIAFVNIRWEPCPGPTMCSGTRCRHQKEPPPHTLTTGGKQQTPNYIRPRYPSQPNLFLFLFFRNLVPLKRPLLAFLDLKIILFSRYEIELLKSMKKLLNFEYEIYNVEVRNYLKIFKINQKLSDSNLSVSVEL